MQNLKHLLFINLAMTLAYCLGGYAGTLLVVPPSNAGTVWPATGIALAGMMTYGRSILPGIFLGALIAQFVSFLDASTLDKTLISFGVAIIASMSSSIQAIVGSTLINRFVGKHDPLIEDRKILQFMLLGGPLGCLISATIAITVLYLRNILDPKDIVNSWVIWWAGDVIGVAIFTPLCLLFIGQPKKTWESRRKYLAYPMITALVMVVAIFQYNLQQDRNRLTRLFELQVNLLNTEIKSQLNQHIKINHALKAFFANADSINKDDFKTFANSIVTNHGSVKAIEWIPRITQSQRQELEQKERFVIREVNTSREMQVANSRDVYFPVYYLEPVKGNEKVLGFDINTNPEVQLVLNKAINNSDNLMVNRIRLIQDQTEKAGLALYQPIYEKNRSLETAEQRNQYFKGFVANIFYLDDEMAEVFNSLKDVQLHLKILDGQQLLYSNIPKIADQQVSYTPRLKTKHIATAGRLWTLQYQPSKDFFLNHQSRAIWWLLLGGFLICALTGLGLLLLTGRTARVEELVFLKTRDLLSTNEKLNSEITKRHQLQLEQEHRNAALEALAKGRSTENILNLTARNAEQLYPNMRCAILLLDNRQNCLRVFAAPSLADFFKEALEGIPVNPSENSCSASAFYKRPIIVKDMLQDFFWQNYRAILLETPLRACWSEPIIASDGRLFGVFANFYCETKEPDTSDLSFMKNMAQLISITIERKQVDAALLENQRILQDAQEVANMGHYVIDIESSTWQSSPIVDSIFGIDSHFTKTLENWKNLIHPDFAESIGDAFSKVIPQNGRCDYVYKIIRPCDKQVRWISVLGRCDYDFAGKLLLILGTVQDITEKKLTDLELERHRIQLQEMVGERTQDVIRAKEFAESANRAKSIFLSNMSHELRTPMHAILSFGKLGFDKSQQENCSISKLNHYFDCIIKSSGRLMPLINDLLDLSKLETGKTFFSLSTHNLRQLILLIYAEISNLAEQKQITIDMDAVPGNIVLQCEGAKIGQVFRNVLSNALKFSPEGSHIKLIATDTELAGRRSEDHLKRPAIALDVIDEGVGIPENELETIFDEFVQSSKTRTSAGGTGLGLAICREIVKGHGGTISASNNAHKGCRFTIVLPLSTETELGD